MQSRQKPVEKLPRRKRPLFRPGVENFRGTVVTLIFSKEFTDIHSYRSGVEKYEIFRNGLVDLKQVEVHGSEDLRSVARLGVGIRSVRWRKLYF